MEEIKHNLPNELDFINEAQNMEKFSKLYAQFPYIKVHQHLCKSEHLSMSSVFTLVFQSCMCEVFTGVGYLVSACM